MQDISPDDRYLIRKSQMDADKKALEAQKAHQDLQRLILELERKYGLLGTGRTIDLHNAVIDGSSHTGNGNGKESIQTLETAV